jgi:putative peptidoglycan lipid II flippase
MGAGLCARLYLIEWLPGMKLGAVLLRASTLCVLGVGVYASLARMFGVHEIVEIEGMVMRKLGSWRQK